MASRIVGTIVVGVSVIAGLGSYASAFEEPIPTRIGLVKFAGSPAAGRLYKLVSKPASP